MRRGDVKYLRDRRPRPGLGLWPVFDGEYHLLYDVTVDGRERADLAPRHPDVVSEMRSLAADFDDEMLSYPDDLPGLPRPASADGPAVGLPD
jgi:hypothetical protein